jgi:hypothetical protein
LLPRGAHWPETEVDIEVCREKDSRKIIGGVGNEKEELAAYGGIDGALRMDWKSLGTSAKGESKGF